MICGSAGICHPFSPSLWLEVFGRWYKRNQLALGGRYISVTGFPDLRYSIPPLCPLPKNISKTSVSIFTFPRLHQSRWRSSTQSLCLCLQQALLFPKLCRCLTGMAIPAFSCQNENRKLLTPESTLLDANLELIPVLVKSTQRCM